MKKLITYSLWGNRPEYMVGAIRNSEMIKDIYPEWEGLFFIHKDVNPDVINKIKNNSKVIIFNTEANHSACILRYFPIVFSGVDMFVSRDCDSRLSDKEYQAVKEWESSDYQFHTMRDSIHHSNPPVLAGMCGFKTKGKVDKNWIWDTLTNFSTGNYGDDQRGLSFLYSTHSDSFLEHDDLLRYRSKKFPNHKPFKFGRFIGQKINEENLCYDDDLGIAVVWKNNEPTFIKV